MTNKSDQSTHYGTVQSVIIHICQGLRKDRETKVSWRDQNFCLSSVSVKDLSLPKTLYTLLDSWKKITLIKKLFKVLVYKLLLLHA
jgi:hypothetical protein